MAQHSSYFSIANASSLQQVPAGGRVHVIGVCGVAMAQLALTLHELGYKVSGSDKEFYEPMGGLLRRSSITLHEGYRAENISGDEALVVIGNAVSYGHPEVSEVERHGLKFTLFPKLLHDLAIRGRHSIVLAGTHGKSTTSAMAAATLARMSRDPSYFVGGVVRDLPKSLHIGNGDVSVVEGDEYDSAFFAKVPKFSFYAPDTMLITAIEYDHADIYPSLAAIEAQFEGAIQALPSTATVICCVEQENLRSLAARWSREARGKVITYARNSGAQNLVSEIRESQGVLHAKLLLDDGSQHELRLKVPGAHNALNALGVVLALRSYGVEVEQAVALLGEFIGVKRRQEVVAAHGGVTVIDDFAHHPTAVHETLSGVRSRYPSSRLVAVFEPRSNTSRRKVFQEAYVRAFQAADQVLLCNVTARSIDPLDQLLDVATLGREIASQGAACRTFPDATAIFETLQRELKPGDVVVVMSNGGFGGLVGLLCDHVAAREG